MPRGLSIEVLLDNIWGPGDKLPNGGICLTQALGTELLSFRWIGGHRLACESSQVSEIQGTAAARHSPEISSKVWRPSVIRCSISAIC